MLNQLFEFMTLAFPKAGAQIGVPLTIAMFLFLLCLVKSQYQVIPAFLEVKGLSTSYLLFVLFVGLALIFNLGNLSTLQLSFVMVVVGSPLAIGIGRTVDPQKAMTILAVSIIVVGAYALIQRVIGIIDTAIPGITYTLGQNLADKPIGFGMAASGQAQKMPSTYQNGNGVGLFYALSLPILLSWVPQTTKQNILRLLGVIFGIIGLLLSGSRSIMLPFGLLLIFVLILLKNKLSYRQQILFLSSVLFTVLLIAIYLMQAHNPFLSQLYARYFEQTLSDPTGADRTVQYNSAFSQIYALDGSGFIRFLCIGLPWDKVSWMEGFVSTLFMYGLFGFLAFISSIFVTVLHIFRRNKLNAIGFFCVFIAFMVDGSFNYPPALMNLFFLAGLLTRPDALETHKNWLTQPLRRGINQLWQREGNQWKLQ